MKNKIIFKVQGYFKIIKLTSKKHTLMKRNQQVETLETILSEPNLTIKQLAQKKAIMAKIKNEFQIFIRFCLEQPSEAKSLIDIGIKTTSFQTSEHKKISFVCNEILCADNEEIVKIFILTDNQNQATNDEDDCCVITDQVLQKNQENFTKKYQNLIYILSFMGSTEANQISLSYIGKLLSTIIAVNPEDLYFFFSKKQDFLNQIIELSVKNQCISEVLAKFVSEESDTKQYRNVKAYIIEQILRKMKKNISYRQQFENILLLIDFILTKNKYRGDQITQLSIVSQKIVDAENINFYIDSLFLAHDPIIFTNSIDFLLMVAKRMNTDEQVDPYYSRFDPDYVQQPTMDFQVNKMFVSLEQFLSLKLTQDYQKLTIMLYYEFLFLLTKNSRWKQVPKISLSSLVSLLRSLKKQRNKSMIQFYIEEIIVQVVEKVPILDGKDIMKVVSVLNLSPNGIKKEQLPFFHKILIVLQEKQTQFRKHFKHFQLTAVIKKYKMVGGTLPENRIFLPPQLKFVNDAKLEVKDSKEREKKGGMQFCQKVIEKTISFPSDMEWRRKQEKDETERATKDESDSCSEEEDEDEFILWTLENPLKKFYLSHLNLF